MLNSISMFLMNGRRLFQNPNSRRTIKYENPFLNTFLNASRQHEILPKTAGLTGLLAIDMKIGSILQIFEGNRYQSNWPILYSISSNAWLTFSPNSQIMKMSANDHVISSNRTIRSIEPISFCRWNWWNNSWYYKLHV